MRLCLAFACASIIACGSSSSGDPPAPAPATHDTPARPAAITIRRDPIDRAALAATLRGRTGPIPLALAADAPYGQLLQVVDVLTQLGLDGELEVGRGGPQPIPRPTAVAAAAPIDDAPILVLTISTDAIYLGADSITRLADVPPGDDIPALATAIAGRPQRPTRLAFRADDAVPGALVVRAIGTARRAGVPDVSLQRHAIDAPRPQSVKRADP
jgi:biopolymer transport protein ExbD